MEMEGLACCLSGISSVHAELEVYHGEATLGREHEAFDQGHELVQVASCEGDFEVDCDKSGLHGDTLGERKHTEEKIEHKGGHTLRVVDVDSQERTDREVYDRVYA